MIHVALRFDDPSIDSDIALERAIFSTLARHHACATVAVIPFRIRNGNPVGFDNARSEHLATAEANDTIEIALHGYSHQKPSNNVRTEFGGATPAQQTAWVAAGLASLRPLFTKPIEGFVPPFNSYDAGTLQALHSNRLNYLSAGFEGPADVRLALVPRTCQMVDLRAAINEARALSCPQSAIIGVMHHYDFVESGAQNSQIALTQFDELVQWLSAQPDVRLCTLKALTEEPLRSFMRRACERRATLHSLPRWLRGELPRHTLMDIKVGKAIIGRLLGH